MHSAQLSSSPSPSLSLNCCLTNVEQDVARNGNILMGPESPPAGAPSIVNAGGTVGATDLLKAPVEVFELNLALPVAQLASQV